jgi:uncharacterized 2Fe-2S/4Fe-4S cluster protein (DUF4445 family)
MPKVTFLPSGQIIEIDEETTIREAAHLLNISVHDRCGGMGACCNCIITIVDGSTNICPKSIVEEAVFYLAENDRLSCQCKLTGDVVVKTI